MHSALWGQCSHPGATWFTYLSTFEVSIFRLFPGWSGWPPLGFPEEVRRLLFLGGLRGPSLDGGLELFREFLFRLSFRSLMVWLSSRIVSFSVSIEAWSWALTSVSVSIVAWRRLISSSSCAIRISLSTGSFFIAVPRFLYIPYNYCNRGSNKKRIGRIFRFVIITNRLWEGRRWLRMKTHVFFELSTKIVDNYERIIPQLKSILNQKTELLRGAKRGK